MITYSETGSFTSFKNVAQQDMNVPKWSRKHKLLWLYSSTVIGFQAVLDKLTCVYNCCHQQRHYLTFFKEFSKIFITVIFLYFYELKNKKTKSFVSSWQILFKIFWKSNESCQQRIFLREKRSKFRIFEGFFLNQKQRRATKVI